MYCNMYPNLSKGHQTSVVDIYLFQAERSGGRNSTTAKIKDILRHDHIFFHIRYDVKY